MFVEHFANNEVVPWNGEKIKPCGMGKPVPPVMVSVFPQICPSH